MEQLLFLGKCMWKGVQALAFDQVFSTSCILVTISLPPQKYWKTSLERELAKAITEIWLREGNFDIHWGGYIFFSGIKQPGIQIWREILVDLWN